MTALYPVLGLRIIARLKKELKESLKADATAVFEQSFKNPLISSPDKRFSLPSLVMAANAAGKFMNLVKKPPSKSMLSRVSNLQIGVVSTQDDEEKSLSNSSSTGTSNEQVTSISVDAAHDHRDYIVSNLVAQ
jgi:hypothetical protein